MFRECNVHVCIGGIVVEATLYCKLRREKSVSITLAEVRQRIWDSRLAVDVCIAAKISGLRIKVEIRVYALVHLVHASQPRSRLSATAGPRVERSILRALPRSGIPPGAGLEPRQPHGQASRLYRRRRAERHERCGCGRHHWLWRSEEHTSELQS